MSELFGYRPIKEEILKNFNQNKLHHALILSGLDGIGKCSFAKLLAQNITDNFSEIKNNPDILLIQRELNQKKELKKDITIDSIRKISDYISLTSSKSKYRVIIIDSIDDLNKNATNALLKNLEEPPHNVFFFLINHNESNILDTIKSRCNIIKIKALTYKDFCSIISANTLNIKDEELRLLFELSNGSVALALEFYQNNSFENYQRILSIISNLIKSADLTRLIEELLKKDVDLKMTASLINLILNRAVKRAKIGLKNEEYFFGNEEYLLHEYLKNNSVENIFRKYDEINEIFLKTKNLNLDKKPSLINIFNIL